MNLHHFQETARTVDSDESLKTALPEERARMGAIMGATEVARFDKEMQGGESEVARCDKERRGSEWRQREGLGGDNIEGCGFSRAKRNFIERR